MRRSIRVALAALAVLFVVLLGIFWPADITAEAVTPEPYDIPGLGIQKLEPIW